MPSITPTSMTGLRTFHSAQQLQSTMQSAGDAGQYDGYYGGGDPTAGLSVPQNYPGMEPTWLTWVKGHAGQILAGVLGVGALAGGGYAIWGRKGAKNRENSTSGTSSPSNSNTNETKRNREGIGIVKRTRSLIDGTVNFLFRNNWTVQAEREFTKELKQLNIEDIEYQLGDIEDALQNQQATLRRTFRSNFLNLDNNIIWGDQITYERQERNILLAKRNICRRIRKEKLMQNSALVS